MKKFDSVQESVSDHCLNYLISGKIDDIGGRRFQCQALE